MKINNKNSELRKILQAIPFLAPSMCGMVIFCMLPMIIATALSFTDWSGLTILTFDTVVDNFVVAKNYIDILSHKEFWDTLLHVLYFVVLYVPVTFLFAMVVALILNAKRKGTRVFSIIYYIPVLTSWVAASLIWKWVLSSKYGIVNGLLKYIGISGPDWLTNKYWAMPGIVLASVWKDMGFYGLYIYGGLKGIDSTYYEAARIDGASKFKILIKVTLPLLSPTLFYCLIMALIAAFQLFPQVQIMTEGGPNGATHVMVERIYNYAFSYFEMGYASAYSWLLFIIILILTLVQLKFQKAWVHYES